MILKNITAQGVFLYAVDTSTAPYGPKTGDGANITGSVSLDGGARAALGTTNPTQIDSTNMPGVYWQPLAQAETNGNAYAFSWKSTTSGVFIQPIFGFTSGVNLPVVAPGASGGLLKIGTSPLPATGTLAAAIWDEINTGNTHNIQNSTGKQLRGITVGVSDVIYPPSPTVLPSQAGMTSTQIKLDSGASSSDQAYQWAVISIVSGTDAGDSRIITSYVGSTRVATVQREWTVQPIGSDSVFEITPTNSAQVVSYIAGQDPATIVWAAATRTITGGTVTTYTGNTPQTGDAFARIGVAGVGLTNLGDARLANLDAAVSTRSTYAGGAVASVTGSVGSVAGGVGGNIDGNLLGTLTGTERNAIADAALVRDWSVLGATATRSTLNALRILRNKWSVSTGTLTVTKEDDTTSAWTATVTTDIAAHPITGTTPL